jgi:hypothetical protein
MLVGAPHAARAQTLAPLFVAARGNNAAYRSAVSAWELARLRYERARIQARTVADERATELTWIGAEIAFVRATEAVYHRTVQSLYDVLEADARLQGLLFTVATARESAALAQTRYQQGLISREDRTEAALALRQAELSVQQAEWAAEDARGAFGRALGIGFDSGVHRALSPEAVFTAVSATAPVSPGQFPESRELRRARIQLDAAKEAQKLLPRNAPEFDRRIAAADVESSRRAVDEAWAAQAEERAELLRQHEALYATARLRRAQAALEEARSAVADEQYENSLISKTQRDQQHARRWSAEATALNAERRYVTAAVSLLAAANADVEEVLP